MRELIFKILNLLLSVIFIICYFYLSFSFILLEFNVLNWDMTSRFLAWALISVASLFRLMDLFYLD